MKTGVALLVEDDDFVRRAVVRVLPREWTRRIATSGREALAKIGAHDDWTLFLIDVALSDDVSGLDVLDFVIATYPDVPRALFTANDSGSIANFAAARRTPVLRKPLDVDALSPLLARGAAMLAASSELSELSARVADLTERACIPLRTAEVLALFVAGKKPSQIAETLGIAVTTVETHAKIIRRKTGAASIRELVDALLRGHRWEVRPERRRR